MKCPKCGKELSSINEKCNCGINEKSNKGEKVAEIVIKLQNGDASAFDALYKETEKYVRYIAMTVAKNESVAEEIVQEVYISIYKKIDTLENPKAALGWIKMIAHNTAVNAYKKESKYVLMTDEEDEYQFDNIEETDTMLLPENALDQNETKEILLKFLDELKPTEKLVLLDYFYNNKKLSEISETNNLPLNTVKTNFARGKKILQNKVIDFYKNTGVKLYSVPAAPVFYFLFREEIQGTISTIAVPGVILSAIGKTGDAIVTTTKKTLGSIIKGFFKKSAVTKSVAGIAAAAVVGTGAATYLNNDEQQIKNVINQYENACKDLDEDRIRSYLSERIVSQIEEDGYNLTDQYIWSEETGNDINKDAQATIKIKSVDVSQDPAIVKCDYITVDGEVKPSTIYMVKENGKWKISARDFWFNQLKLSELIDKDIRMDFNGILNNHASKVSHGLETNRYCLSIIKNDMQKNEDGTGTLSYTYKRLYYGKVIYSVDAEANIVKDGDKWVLEKYEIPGDVFMWLEIKFYTFVDKSTP